MRGNRLIRWIRARLGDRADVGELARRGLRLGREVHVGPGVRIDAAFCQLVTLGDRCVLASDVSILTHDASARKALGYTRIAPVVVEEDAFVGARAVLLPGVRVGAGAIVGAGSVVTRDVPPGAIVAGNPARVVGTVAERAARLERRLAEEPRLEDPREASREVVGAGAWVR